MGQNKTTNYVSVNSLIQTKKHNGIGLFSMSAATVQAKKTTENMEYTEPIQKQANHTGLPDDLKTGVENCSGFSLDDVRVHYNSSKPGQMQALAYTQGTDIHVAPGQEKHLPHEAWHVVQQIQGRVQPTFQMKGMGVGVNDDPKLEREADMMGREAISTFINKDAVAHIHESPNNQLSKTVRDRNLLAKNTVHVKDFNIGNNLKYIVQLRKNINQFIRHKNKGIFGRILEEYGESPNYSYRVAWYNPETKSFDGGKETLNEKDLCSNLEPESIVGKYFKIIGSRDIVYILKNKVLSQRILKDGNLIGRDERQDTYWVQNINDKQETEITGANLANEIEGLILPQSESQFKENITKQEYFQMIPSSMEKKEKVWGYRGDSRSTDEIFRAGFSSRYHMPSPVFRSSVGERGQHDIDPVSAINAARNPIAACLFPLYEDSSSNIYIFQADKFFDTKAIQEWAVKELKLSKFKDQISNLLFAEEMAITDKILPENIIGAYNVKREWKNGLVELTKNNFIKNYNSKFQKMSTYSLMLKDVQKIPDKYIFHLPTKNSILADNNIYLRAYEKRRVAIRNGLLSNGRLSTYDQDSGYMLAAMMKEISGKMGHMEREDIFNQYILKLEKIANDSMAS